MNYDIIDEQLSDERGKAYGKAIDWFGDYIAPWVDEAMMFDPILYKGAKMAVPAAKQVGIDAVNSAAPLIAMWLARSTPKQIFQSIPLGRDYITDDINQQAMENTERYREEVMRRNGNIY